MSTPFRCRPDNVLRAEFMDERLARRTLVINLEIGRWAAPERQMAAQRVNDALPWVNEPPPTRERQFFGGYARSAVG